jgi:hypothetical protein
MSVRKIIPSIAEWQSCLFAMTQIHLKEIVIEFIINQKINIAKIHIIEFREVLSGQQESQSWQMWNVAPIQIREILYNFKMIGYVFLNHIQ